MHQSKGVSSKGALQGFVSNGTDVDGEAHSHTLTYQQPREGMVRVFVIRSVEGVSKGFVSK